MVGEEEMYTNYNDQDPQFVSIADVLRSIRRRLWVIILVPLAIVGATVAFSLLQTPTYEATATVLVGQQQGQGDNPARVEELQALTLSAVDIITTRPVAEQATSGLGLAMDPDAVLENLTAEPTESGQLIKLTYTDTNPQRTQRVVNALSEVASERISTLPVSGQDVRATVVEAASVPRTPEEPDPLRNAILGAVMGAMVGFGLAFVMEVVEPSGKPRGRTE
jgi:polysaccharide biosynthesis transport protein